MKPSTESVASFCARYLEDHRGAIAPTTYARNSDILNVHVVPALGRVSRSSPSASGIARRP